MHNGASNESDRPRWNQREFHLNSLYIAYPVSTPFGRGQTAAVGIRNRVRTFDCGSTVLFPLMDGHMRLSLSLVWWPRFRGPHEVYVKLIRFWSLFVRWPVHWGNKLVRLKLVFPPPPCCGFNGGRLFALFVLFNGATYLYDYAKYIAFYWILLELHAQWSM